MKKRVISMLLVVVMVFGLMPTISIASATTGFAGGSGTETDPYLVSTKEHLDNVRNYLNAHFKMTNDIEFTDADFAEGGAFYNNGSGFARIGSSSTAPFKGTFDGNGFALKKMSRGLFGFNDGTVKNLGIIDCDFTAKDSYYVGGVAGYNNGLIENCYNTSDMTAESTSMYYYTAFVGGIVGKNYEGIIRNCYNTGNITSNNYAGGIVGLNENVVEYCYNLGKVSGLRSGGIAGESNHLISKCYNEGTVDCNYPGKYSSTIVYVGGIAGYHDNATNIINCFNKGAVSSDYYAGGIAGWSRRPITNCYNIGNVTSNKYAGGILGSNSYAPITNCYYINKNSSFYGTGSQDVYNSIATKCTDEQMQQQSTYVGFDFDTVWEFDTDVQPYPVLRGIHIHEFENDCDATCDCGYERETSAHVIEKVIGEAATQEKDGFMDYYTCHSCGVNYADENGVIVIEDIEYWKQNDGKIESLSKWEVEAYKDGVVIVKYKGDATDVFVPATIKVDGIDKKVLKLGDELFADNDTVNSVTLAESITEIGDRAFYDADQLVCIVTSEALTTIGDEAFAGCDNFNSVILYDSVTEIGTDAFANCPKLTIWCNEDSYACSYAVENDIPYEIINPSATPETVELDGITYYILNGKAYAVDADDTLTEVVIPAYVNGYPVTELRETFKDCTNLIKVTLPETITNIGDNSFYNCKNLTEVNIPNLVTNIGDYAFYNCQSLIEVIIPASVTNIGYNTFRDCDSITSIVLHEGLKTIGYGAFGYCDNLISVIIPDGVTYIAGNVFEKCTKLEEVTIGNGIPGINSYEFSGCINLTKVNIPASVKRIENSAFSGCKNLTEIEIPDSVTYIGNYAFSGCSSLRMAIIPENVVEMYKHSFSSTTVLLVYEGSYAHTFAEENNLLYYIYEGTILHEFIEAEGITYCIVDGKAIAIDADDTLTEAVIPAQINNYPVTELRNTFKNCEKLTKVTLPETITYIGDSAFYHCINLAEVNIPASVTSIGDNAFYYCRTLTEIDISNVTTSIGDHAFDNCFNISGVVFSNKLKTIGEYAFHSCYDITSIVIPDSVTSIGVNAFMYCNNLKEVTIGRGMTAIPAAMFHTCRALTKVNIPDTVKSIEEYAFCSCESLTEINIPDSVTHIDISTFASCLGIEMVVIPEGVEKIDISSFPESTVLLVYENFYAHTFAIENDRLYFVYDGVNLPEIEKIGGITYVVIGGKAIAIDFDESLTEVEVVSEVNGCPVTELRETFRENRNITKVTLPETITTIGDFAFYGCSALTEVNIPDSVTNIGDKAFTHCSKLAEINIPEAVTSLGEWAFGYCYALTSIELPKGLKSIGTYAFYDCNGITSIVVPDSVTVIDEYAFYECSNLSKVTLGNGIIRVPRYGFAHCTSLTEINIPDSVKFIETYAFDGCANLSKVNIPESVTFISSRAFYNCASLKMVVVPESINQMYESPFPESTILVVVKDSYVHKFAKNNNLLYFVIQKGENPEFNIGISIFGNVTYVDGSAAADATVEIFYEDGTLKESVKTDKNGDYRLTYAEVGRYTIRVTDEFGNVASENISVKRMNVFSVFVSGDTLLTLKKSYAVSGTLTNATDADVTLSDLDGNVIYSTKATDGTFTFENVSNGTYILKAETENGSVTTEITVYNGNISDINLTIKTVSATISGYVSVENRDKTTTRKNWVDVTLYNADGTVVAQTKSDKDGKYQFNNIPLGEYTIVAEAEELRPDYFGGYDRNYQLTGYAHVSATEAKTYELDEIILREPESNDSVVEISGKVTAQGSSQKGKVVLEDVFHNEIATCDTNNNGKFTFKNVRDGMYLLVATTESEGMGCSVIVVRDGEVSGSTDIRVYKSDKIQNRENIFTYDLGMVTEANVENYRDRIAEEKEFYDGLSKKEKKQLSEEYVERLNQLVEWLTNCEYNVEEGVQVEQGGLAVSGDELTAESDISFTLTVTKQQNWEENENGVESDKDFIHHKIKDAAGKKEIKQYYEISLSKTVDGVDQVITDVVKNTDATGSFRITMDIPEEYRGYKNYSLVHVHNGETVLLTDLDDNPDTITFEVNKFSTFALAATNEDLSETPEDVYAAVNVETGKTYETFDEALADTKSGETLKLTSDVTAGSVVVLPGVTLDLNGYSLTVDYLVGLFGSQIVDNGATVADTSTGDSKGLAKTGRIFVKKDSAIISKNNAQLPLYDGTNGCYVFIKNTMRDDYIYYDFEKGVYVVTPIIGDSNGVRRGMMKTLLGSGNIADSGFALEVRVSWETYDNTTGDLQYKATQSYTYNDKLVSNFVNGYGKNGSNYAASLSAVFKGDSLKQADYVYVSTVLVSSTGVEIESSVTTIDSSLLG